LRLGCSKETVAKFSSAPARLDEPYRARCPKEGSENAYGSRASDERTGLRETQAGGGSWCPGGSESDIRQFGMVNGPARQRAWARMRRCLILRQGTSPLRPPAPFPSASMFQNGGNLSRVRKPRRNGAPLTDCHRSEDSAEMRERGPLAKRAVIPRRSGNGALRAHEALPHTPPGGKPPETPVFFP
jgi:hypothetical protein